MHKSGRRRVHSGDHAHRGAERGVPGADRGDEGGGGVELPVGGVAAAASSRSLNGVLL